MSEPISGESFWLKDGWKVGDGPELALRDHLWLLDLTLDYQAQLIAIHSLLQRNRAAERKTADAIKEVEQHAQDAADDILSQRAVDEWVDRLHHSVFEDAAHSMAAIGMLAPFVESLFFQSFQQIGDKFAAPTQKKANRRWLLPAEKQWDCHYVADEKAISKDLSRGVLQLIDALGLNERFPTDLRPTLEALFGYRNKMFHLGFEWPIEERMRFAQRITDEGWPKGWFRTATHDKQPWIFYVSEEFISHALRNRLVDRWQKKSSSAHCGPSPRTRKDCRRTSAEELGGPTLRSERPRSPHRPRWTRPSLRRRYPSLSPDRPFTRRRTHSPNGLDAPQTAPRSSLQWRNRPARGSPKRPPPIPRFPVSAESPAVFTAMLSANSADDPREVASIPEIRNFYTSFREAWPYWLYFCNLDSEEFSDDRPMLPSFDRSAESGPRNQSHRRVRPAGTAGIPAGDFGPMNTMCERTGMFEQHIDERTRAIFGYFGLPFDA